MKKDKLISLLLMFFISLVFMLAMILNIKSYVLYTVLIIMIGLSVFIIQNKNFLSANFLFYAMYLYSVGIGPILLMKKGTFYNYYFFKIVLGGLLAFSWGSFFFSNEAINYKPKKVSKKVNFSYSRISIVRILYGISVLAGVIYILKNKDLLLGGNMQDGRIKASSGLGIILYTMQLSIMLVPAFYELYLYGKENNKKIVSKFELLFVILFSSIELLFTGFRAPLITMYICLIVLYVRKNNKKIVAMIPYGIAIILIVELLGILRNLLSGINISTGLIKSLNTSLIVNCINLKYIFDCFPAKVPFQHGYTYLINVLMLLPGPDLDFTLWLKEQLNLSFMGGGVTPTILGEFYINFGSSSIFLGMFLLGILGNFITEYFEKNSKSFIGAFFIWQFAHCTSGGIANVLILSILFFIVYSFITLFPIIKEESGENRQLEQKST